MSFGQGGPYGPGDGPSSAPDWAALADESAARDKRRRWMFVGGGVLATLVVAGIVAGAVVMSDGSSDPEGKSTALPSQNLPSDSVQPQPSFSDVSVPPPPDPADFITDPSKDTAPLTAASLFPTKTVSIGGRNYSRLRTAATDECDSAANGDLVTVLSSKGCRRMVRATFRRNNVAMTVGIAVFPSKSAAGQAYQANKTGLAPLSVSGVNFCHGSACLNTVSTEGRYAYFTLTGYTDGKDVKSGDSTIQQVTGDGKAYAFGRLQQRGQNQADAFARKQQKELEKKQGH